MKLIEVLLRIEWHKTFGYGKPFPEFAEPTEEDIKWAKDVIKSRK